MENEISVGIWIKPPFLDAGGNWFSSVTEENPEGSWPWCGDLFLAAFKINKRWYFAVLRFSETGIETGEGDYWEGSAKDIEWIAKINNPGKA